MQFRFTRMVVFIIGLGVAASACGQYSISNLRAIRAFKEANKSYQAARYSEAVAGYEEAISHNPDFLGSVYFFLGDSYERLYKPVKKGDPTNDGYLHKAVANYEKAIEKTKDEEFGGQGKMSRRRAYEFLIAIYGPEKLNDPAKAEPVAIRLVASDPTDASSYMVLGSVYEQAKRLDEAEAQYKKAIDVKPNDAVGYQTLAGFYSRQDQFEKTIEALNARAQVEPNNAEAWQMIASLYQEAILKDFRLSIPKQKEYTMKGIDAVNKALQLNPDYYEATAFKNILLRVQAKFEKDPKRQKDLIDEADRLEKRALELQKRLGGKGGN